MGLTDDPGIIVASEILQLTIFITCLTIGQHALWQNIKEVGGKRKHDRKITVRRTCLVVVNIGNSAFQS